ncbi:MAG: hypothetical protein ACRETM_14100 [Stenotrophobium sp.]
MDNNEANVADKMTQQGFCIYIDTVCDGPIPVERKDDGTPVVYGTYLQAQRVIAEDMIDRLHEFLDGQRDFDDAITIEEHIVKVDVMHDGSIRGQYS